MDCITEAPIVAQVEAQALTDAQLVEHLATHHRNAEQAAATAVDRAIAAGDVLIEAKRRCKHGEWQAWLAKNFAGSDRTARTYMRLAKNRDTIAGKTEGSSVLTIGDAMQSVAGADAEADDAEFRKLDERIRSGLEAIADGDGWRSILDEASVRQGIEPCHDARVNVLWGVTLGLVSLEEVSVERIQRIACADDPPAECLRLAALGWESVCDGGDA